MSQNIIPLVNVASRYFLLTECHSLNPVLFLSCNTFALYKHYENIAFKYHMYLTHELEKRVQTHGFRKAFFENSLCACYKLVLFHAHLLPNQTKVKNYMSASKLSLFWRQTLLLHRSIYLSTSS